MTRDETLSVQQWLGGLPQVARDIQAGDAAGFPLRLLRAAPGAITLQGYGFAIVLWADGTYSLGDTSGG